MATTDSNFIEVSDIYKAFGSQRILNGLSLDVRVGETLVIIGSSGCGKSVLLKHLVGLLAPDSGRVVVDGTDITALGERQLAPTRKKMGMLFQNGALFDSLNVAENVAFPLREHGVRDAEEVRTRVEQSLEVVGLGEHLEKMPVDLSGGMRKRVALARAIITEPKCILYDEPTTGLDPVVADSINHLIRRTQKQFGVTSVVVTHDMTSAYHVGERIAYLREGGIYFCGSPEELENSNDPSILDFINGRSGERS